MLHLLASIALVLLISSGPFSAQVSQPAYTTFTHLEPRSSGNYKPPPLSQNSIDDDPGIQKAVTHLYTGDLLGFRTELLTQAKAGNPAAHLMLGIQYVPKETFALPSLSKWQANMDQRPKIVPETKISPLSKIFPPSYSEALKWLTLASAQGSGEASELVAQIILRMLDEHQASTYTAIDAAHYRSLAVQQGYDLEDVSVRCLRLTRSTRALTCDARPGSCPTPDEMQGLRGIGLAGTLEPEGGASSSMTSITMHPGGPPARAIVIIDHNIDAKQRLPLPRHASTIYVQQAKGWLALPKDGPVLNRDIILTPGEDAFNAVMVYVEDVNGDGSGGMCTPSIGPFAR
ncbi:hypothetical protein JAO29_12030 [Edaphobacter sp. HDX4]|uniref:hypothetical protein n=1 Tax=Edaphobacter sp. HDX4 TaxID=2794064 RepID=UPI002FE54E49